MNDVHRVGLCYHWQALVLSLHQAHLRLSDIWLRRLFRVAGLFSLPQRCDNLFHVAALEGGLCNVLDRPTCIGCQLDRVRPAWGQRFSPHLDLVALTLAAVARVRRLLASLNPYRVLVVFLCLVLFLHRTQLENGITTRETGHHQDLAKAKPEGEEGHTPDKLMRIRRVLCRVPCVCAEPGTKDEKVIEAGLCRVVCHLLCACAALLVA